MIDRWTLATGDNIKLPSGCEIIQPRLSRIRELGLEAYSSALGIVMQDVDSILSAMGVDTAQLPLDYREDLTAYRLIVLSESLRKYLLDAFSFFIVGRCQFIPASLSFAFSNEKGDFIAKFSEEDYPDFQAYVRQLCCIESKKAEVKTFRSEKAKRIYEKIQKGRKEMNALKKTNSDLEMGNVIAAVVSKACGYTYDNIWNLTVYQLYDLFYRLNTDTQLDVYGTRWAAYGKEDFDFSVWYKPPLN